MGETRGSYNKKALVVSQTEPTNPSDGLLWYKPDLCLTTTTTTRIPCDYEGVLTVGNLSIYYGYALGLFGSIDPLSTEVASVIFQDDPNNNLQVILNSSLCFDFVTLFINNTEHFLPWFGLYEGNNVYLIGMSSNPFPAVGETCNIRICYGTPCTTTTTEIGTTTTTPQPQ